MKEFLKQKEVKRVLARIRRAVSRRDDKAHHRACGEYHDMCSKHLLASAHQDMAILYREIARVIQFACKEREDAEARRAQK